MKRGEIKRAPVRCLNCLVRKIDRMKYIVSGDGRAKAGGAFKFVELCFVSGVNAMGHSHFSTTSAFCVLSGSAEGSVSLTKCTDKDILIATY